MAAKNVTQRTLQIHKPSALEIWLRDFLLDAEAANRTDATIGFYKQKLKPFVAYLDGQRVITPQDITPRHVRSFLADLRQTHNDGGVHAFWRAIRAFIRFMVREDGLDKNPLDKVRAPTVDTPLLDPVPLATVNAMLAICDRSQRGSRDRAIILTLLDTGVRAGELIRLNVGDIDLNDGSVAVRKTKGRKGRNVFLGKESRRSVAAYMRARPEAEPNEPLFLAYHINGDITRLTPAGLRMILKLRAELAKVPMPSPHAFRRTFALTMLESGADVISLSRLMGHGSLPVVQRYLKQLKEHLGKVHAQHSPGDLLKGKRR